MTDQLSFDLPATCEYCPEPKQCLDRKLCQTFECDLAKIAGKKAGSCFDCKDNKACRDTQKCEFLGCALDECSMLESHLAMKGAGLL